MAGGDRREPLWASSLADQPRGDYDDVFRSAPEEPEQAAPSTEVERTAGRRPLVLALAGLAAVALVLMLLPGRGSLTLVDVPSSWGDVPMSCHTARIERDGRALEWFRCRATGAAGLPPGVYRSPEARWTSDITRRDARTNELRISPDGELTGWALYD